MITQALWWIMLAAAGIILLTAAYLAFLNWNETLKSTTISVVLGGAVAFFIAVMAGLKGTTISYRFVSAVVLDAQGLPVWFGANNYPVPPAEIASHLSALRSIAADHPFPPSNPNSRDRQNHAAKLLQYHLLKALAAMGSEAGCDVTVAGDISVRLRSAIRCRLRAVAPEEVGNLDSNSFAGTARERRVLSDVPIRIPDHAHVMLCDDKGPSIVFWRNGYFRVSMTIQSLGDAVGVLPKGFEYLQARAFECHSIPLLVEINAHFEKYTGGSRYTSDVQTWVQAVSERMCEVAATQPGEKPASAWGG